MASLSTWPSGISKHAPDVAQHAAREERAEGDDLRDAVGAVALADIADHLVAAILAEVDVEIRHRDALGIEEALEQEPEPDRIEIGDRQRVGDERAGARAAARPDRNALRLRPLDEIGDDEEIAGEFHPHDDGELELEPLAIIILGETGRPPIARHQPLETFARLPAQLLLLVDRLAAGNREARQDGLARQRPVGAAQRDLDAVVRRLGQVLEQRAHLGAGLESMLRGQAAAIGRGDEGALGDAEQRVLRLEIGRGGEIGLVGRDERKRMIVGQIDQRRLDRGFAVEAMALQLDIEPVAEQPLQPLQPREREIGHVQAERAVDRPGRAAGQRDQPFAIAQRIEFHMRLVAVLGIEPDAGGEPHQREVAALVLGEQHDRRALEALVGEPRRAAARRVGEIDRDLRADDRLYPRFGELLRELERAEQIVRIGDRQSRHRVRLGELGERLDAQRPLAQGIGAVDVEVDETDGLENR